jgi:hypothetical protein
MPFGMGSIFGAIRGGLGAAGGAASRYAMRNAFAGGARGTTGLAAAGAGDILRYTAGMSNLGLTATMGGVTGGIYGAFADDTSVLGGALGGAMLGAGGYGGAMLGRRGLRAYGGFRRAGMGAGQAAGQAFGVMGDVSSAYIGNTARRAYNSFSGFARGFARGFAG